MRGSWQVIEGDCREELARLEPESVQTCVTSPPYWGLRDYGTEGQLGLEPTPEQYVENLVAVFREVRRVLRDDGTVWLNLGDSYAGSGKGPSNSYDRPAQNMSNVAAAPNRWQFIPHGIKAKDLVGIPWRVAFALQADGWWLRSDIIWAKPNPMPESVTDRPTRSHEYIFLLTKSARYFYDAEAVREQGKDWSTGGPGTGITPTLHYGADNGGNEGLSDLASRYKSGEQAAGRNRRSVWTVTTQPYPEAHFATFPPRC
jgi:DNA modification methylase